MFCICHSDLLALKVHGLTIWPENLSNNHYSLKLTFDCGNGEQHLLPVIMDIIGTACPFADTSKFKPEHICFITITYDDITLSYQDPHDKSDDGFSNEATIDFSVTIAALMNALQTKHLKLGIYFFRDRNSDTKPCEAYNIAYDENDDGVATLRIATSDRNLDAFLVERKDAYVSSSLDDEEEDDEFEEDEDEYE